MLLQDAIQRHHRIASNLLASTSGASKGSEISNPNAEALPASRQGVSGRVHSQRGSFRTFASGAEPASAAHDNASNSMDFPGGRVPFTDRLSFVGGSLTPAQPMPCYRTLDATGWPSACQSLWDDTLLAAHALHVQGNACMRGCGLQGWPNRARHACGHAACEAGKPGVETGNTHAGLPIEDARVPHELGQELALRMHEAMVRLQTMDVIFYEAQRQVSPLIAV